MPFPLRLLAAPVAALSLSASAYAGDLSVVGTGDGIEALRVLGASYSADNTQTVVRVPPSIHSSGGIAAVGSNTEILGRIARPLSESEKAAGLIEVPVFRLPAAIYVHRSVGVTDLTAKQLEEIYAGTITNWRQVGGADLRIKEHDAWLENAGHHREVEDCDHHTGWLRHCQVGGRRNRLRPLHARTGRQSRCPKDRWKASDGSQLPERRHPVDHIQGSNDYA